uniref:Glutamate-rich protein 1 isoform X1 n=1 Tax=Pogona vitticeps TaxID=103695 RepID=A0A6J0SX92_9SAUR
MAMALRPRAEVFRKKVLEKLFPAPPDALSSDPESSAVLRTSVSKLGQEDPVNLPALEGSSSSPVEKKNSMILPSRKIYTVSPPPEDYMPTTNNDISNENLEGDDSDSDADVSEEDGQGQPQRKRIRRKKRKNGLQNPDNLHRGPAEYEEPKNPIEENLQLVRSEGPNLSRNQKRKMKKKRQKEKMRASGLLTKPAAIEFMYKPETEERISFEEAHKKANDILDFLQATQEIYFSEKRSKCAESAVSSQSVGEVLQSLESDSVSSSDITLLHRMKSLVLLQDVERIKDAVEEFRMQTAMPPDHAKAISSLFLYWVTDILPGKDRK